MQNKPLVFAVDDDPLNCEIMSELLEDDFQVTTFLAGSECLESVERNTPDLLLLDVGMPGLNGYEVCKLVRTTESMRDIPIIFVSALTTLEDRMEGYEAGGDDYLTKPFKEEELLVKAQLALRNSRNSKELKGQVSIASNTALLAMTNTAEQGVILEFLSDAFNCTQYSELAELIIKSIGQFGLSCGVQFFTADGPMYFNSDHTDRPIEREIMQMVKNISRIHTFRNRTFFSGPDVCILVKNIPVENEELCGRLRDHLALLLKGVESKLKPMRLEIESKRRENTIRKACSKIQENLVFIEMLIKEERNNGLKVLTTMLDSLDEGIHSLGLERDQEEHFTQLIHHSSDDLFTMHENIDQIRNIFSETISVLKQ
ncbi:MAG: hypothetical protein COB04_00320 [Gammaproteobacteria bacterium]|nr:MAG: hypothetical protein COB04_00320 [Gammaproteobacteria bacterium]